MKVILEIIWVSGHPYYDLRNQLVDYLVVILGGKYAAYKTRNERDCTQTSQKWQDSKTQIKLTISLLQKNWERSSETGPFDFKVIMIHNMSPKCTTNHVFKFNDGHNLWFVVHDLLYISDSQGCSSSPGQAYIMSSSTLSSMFVRLNRNVNLQSDYKHCKKSE